MADSLENILNKLQGVKKHGKGFMALCPAHADRQPSLSITPTEDGKVLINCLAGCEYKKVAEALGLTGNSGGERIIAATYDYQDETGKLLYQVVRYQPKGFMQRRPDGDDWTWDLRGVERVLYHLPEIIEEVASGSSIYIVEGEKDCDRLRDLGLSATTCAGGSAQKWKPQYTFTLRGAKSVTLISDNDEAGIAFTKRIATQLFGWVKSLKILGLPGAGAGEDVSNWLDKDNDILGLAMVWANSPEFIPTGAPSREEFFDLRGHMIYLAKMIELRGYARVATKPYTHTSTKREVSA